MENTFVNREITVGNKVFVAKQRTSDRWFDATAMCKAWKKDWHEYHRNKKTRDFLNCLKVSQGSVLSLARVATDKTRSPPGSTKFKFSSQSRDRQNPVASRVYNLCLI
jgi:hypothetical protein